jgi:hypothetical protein
MRIRRVPSTNLRHDHDELVEVLMRCEADNVHGALVRIGIRNHYGDVCLLVECDGPQEALNVTSCLEGREMFDELAETGGPVERCDAIYRNREHHQ